ncbi:MAG: hypothetical protein HUJ71_09190 [Pseudobutyrivibrio sp.]|nr:hypothetical protein [Pseudobutyrivibrio sp.]
MIGDFLKKYQQEIISEKIDVKEELDLLETKIKEEKKFIEVLDNTNESFFSDFTPRDVNAKNRQKIMEVQSLVDELQEKYNQKSEKQRFLDGRLREINRLLQEINNDNHIVDVTNEPKTIITEETNEEEDNTVNYSVIGGLSGKLEQIKSYVFFDPQRASMELDEILKFLNN